MTEHADELPYNADAEEAVLCALLIESHRAAPVIAPIVRASDFHGRGHGTLYRAMMRMVDRGEAVDPVTLADELALHGELEHAGGKEYIGYLLDAIPTAAGVEGHAKIVRQYADGRSLLLVLEGEAKRLRSGKVKPADVAGKVADAVLAVQTVGAEGFVSAKTIATELVTTLLERAENGVQIIGVPTGFRDIDRLQCGQREGELTILAGVPGSGKTALGLQICINNAVLADRACAFVSAEMAKADLIERAVANIGKIDTRKLRRMDLVDDEFTRVGRALEILKASPLYVDDTPTPDVRDVMARCRALKMRHPELKLIVVDFIQLLNDGDNENRAEELRSISYALKGMAKLLKVHVIALAQLNDKTVEGRPDKRPQLGDLQGSSGMRQAADFVVLCYRPRMYDDMAPADVVQANYAKCRGVSPFSVELSAQLQYMKITDLESVSW